MIKREKYFLLVPPKNKRVRNFRIRVSIILFFLILFLGGVAGFLLPIDTVSLDVVEVNQMRSFTAQNKKLLSKIRTMRENLFSFKEKLDVLGKMKNVISGLVAIDEQAAVTDAPGKKFFKKINTYDLLSHVTSAESFYNDFIEMVREHPEYFEYLPIIKPVSDECIITARFGKKKDPFTGEIKWHNGIDFSGERETPVFAAASGTVEMVQDHNFWGRRIRIGHRFGFSTVYAHLGTVYACQGKNVKKGEVIGTIGLSGMTVGPHLHYEVHHNDSAVDAGNFFFPDTLSVAYTPAH